MSESNSTPSPISGSRLDEGGDDHDLTADLDLGFDGAEDVLRAWRRGMRPDPDLTVSEWADQHRQLSSRASAEPGQYRTSRTPYLREIMDALSPGHPAQRVSFMKAAQVGATEAGNNWIGFVIHHAPGPMLAVLPTVEMAKRSSRGRIDPLIADSAALKERVQPARSRDAGNSMLSKEFPGGILVLTGANSATGLRSMPARYIFLDEVDAYPASSDEEGDPVTLAEARSTKAKGHLHDIWQAETKAEAEAAFDFFIETYGVKYDKAVAKLVKDREVLLSFYDFPAEHWKHIRTSNPIESSFATVRHRTGKTKGCLSRKTGLAMAFRLMMSAQVKWRKLDGANRLPEVVQGIAFKDGIKQLQAAA